MSGSRVRVPATAQPPFTVFVNGVEQREGEDYELRDRELVFARDLIPPRRDTIKTYARLMFWGRYNPEHSVDVAYRQGGTARVASKLEILPPAETPHP